MAKKLQLNRCWKHVRITIGEGYLEVREHKPNQTLVATLVMSLGLLFGAMLIASVDRSSDFAGVFAGVVLTVLPIAWVLVVYRIPRGLRFYPEQQSARNYRTIYGLILLSRWTNLRERQLEVQLCTVYSMEAADGKTKTAIALTGLFAAIGILGTVLSLGVSNKLHERRRTAYAIQAGGSKKPLAIFLSREYADRAVYMYEAALKNDLDGYRPSPNRFEKPPGA